MNQANMKQVLSNIFLAMGILLLFAFGIAEISGSPLGPVWPAFAALLIGCSAVLDRQEAEEPTP